MKIITQAIPTNIITGFLGVGKTTAIMNLLREKPANERWAVLVNEFGEVGIDAALIRGGQSEQQADELFIREVPGGCMCCTAGVPMQVALNQLIKQAKPDRLLIEPTGLGHPKEVIETLSAPHYQDVIDLQTTITLVDARHLADPKYRHHDTFIQQHQVADLIVANKSELYQGDELQWLNQFLTDLNLQHLPVEQVSQAELDPAWLASFQAVKKLVQPVNHLIARSTGMNDKVPEPSSADSADSRLIAEQGYVRKDNVQGDEHSSGWIFEEGSRFDYLPLYALLSDVPFTRLKGIFNTTHGPYAYNWVSGALSSCPMRKSEVSKVEVIGGTAQQCDAFQQALLKLTVAEQ